MPADGNRRLKSTNSSSWFRRFAIAGLVLALAHAALFWFLRNPTFLRQFENDRISVDTARLRQNVSMLTSIEPNRSVENPESLNKAADLIEAEFSKTGCTIEQHRFRFQNETYRNITCSFGPATAKRVILGAHYDVLQHSHPTRSAFSREVGKTMPGADDNASGVAGILEIARMIAREQPALEHRLDLVAFTLEEIGEMAPDGSGLLRANIGSHEYVSELQINSVDVKLMVSVEMIGYFDTTPNSQSYPEPLAPILYAFYPGTADFIGVVGRAWDRRSIARVRDLMLVSDEMPVYSINAPRRLVPAIARSDHANFWNAGFPAVMVTDTAEFRNPHYHRATDKLETLDFERMALVVEGLYRVAVQY